ncbi:MAG: TrkH family potassium uptake protein [Oscillospiraceae bacterium]|nr:TrkH family potassium uptake protein [Oscillospiraceae bacterium]
MNYKMMARFIAFILVLEAIFMLPALAISVFCNEPTAIRGFLYSLGVILVIVALLFLIWHNDEKDKGFYAREGMICVGIGWIALGLLGALPFYLSGEIPLYIDAFFETVSGFTTTGASILNNVEALSHGLLYWRSFSHWVGGMGVLVFILAVLPQSGGFTMHILRAESPGPNVSKLVPRMRQTATILYLLYIALTVLCFIFLLIGRMPVFDAVCTAFGTAGTGGFGVKNDSIASYSPYLQNVCTVFMLLFGVNFSCYYLLLAKKFLDVFRDEELRLYFGVVLASVALISLNIRGFYSTMGETVRHAAFQVASIITTTGFATTDFDLWPSFSKAILLCLMFLGACAGSTGGGLKCIRLLILLKGLRRNIRKVLRPNDVRVVKNNGQTMDEKIVENTNSYFAAYMVIIMLSFVLISLDGFSIATNFSAVVACFNNIGPGFEAVGATCNYSGYSAFSKLVLIFDMLAGRLEIFPILLLGSRATWRRV